MIRTRRPNLIGWSTSHRRRDDGATESTQRAVVTGPAVDRSADGAAALGAAYWRAVARTTGGLVSRREIDAGSELRLGRGGPVLLRFGPPSYDVNATGVSAAFPITGGLLARRPSGSLTLSMEARARDGEVELRSAIAGYYPALAARPGAPAWTGEIYNQVQARMHARVSRSYFVHLAHGVPG
jgi:hypothetical protein